MTSDQLIQLIETHQYTTLVAVLVFGALKVWAWVKPAVWGKVPSWGKTAIPIAAVALGGFADALQGGATWLDAVLAGALLIATHHLTKVKRVVAPDKPPDTKRTGPTVAAASMLILLSGCSVLKSEPVQQAGQVIDAACALGLVHSPALLQLLEAQGLPPGAAQWGADRLCQIPEVIAAFRKARLARSVDPGEEAIAAARQVGAL